MQENFARGNIMQFTLREMLMIARAPRLWATFIVIVLVFVVIGPSGTASMPPAIRFFYWLSIQFAGWSTAILFAVVADVALKRWIASAFIRMMIGSLIAAIPIGLWVGLINYGFVARQLSIEALGANIATSLPLSALFCVLAYMTLKREIASISQPLATMPAPLMQRLKPENRGQLLRLSADDHYTQVVTHRGRELVLLRFSDALKEIGDTAGLQIHRSHWIADAHVSALQKSNGALHLLTRDGTLLPVSRSSQKAARQKYETTATLNEKA